MSTDSLDDTRPAINALLTQGQSMDLEYLERWAALLNVAELLARARAEA